MLSLTGESQKAGLVLEDSFSRFSTEAADSVVTHRPGGFLHVPF